MSPISEVRTTRDRLNKTATATAIGGLLKDKVLFDQTMAGAGFPVPTTFGIADPESFLTFRPAPAICELAEVTKLLEGLAAFCKPARGMGGDGSFSVVFEAGQAQVEGEVLSATEFAALLAERAQARGRRRSSRRLVVQERVGNDPSLGRLYDGCVNTLRLLTHNRHGRPRAFSAVLRAGAGGNAVDNWDAGGLVVPVDLATGRTHGGGIRKKDRAKFTHHPDTGVEFAGIDLPHYPQARATAEVAHCLFPDMLTIGWDIALTPEGPRVLEGNMKWDITMHHLTDPRFHRYVMDEILLAR